MTKILIKESELKSIIKNTIYNSKKERQLINLVETRGMYQNYNHLISPVIRYVQEYINKNKYNRIIRVQKIDVESYKVEIPSSLLDKIEWADNKHITITVLNITNRDLDRIGETMINNYRHGSYISKKSDHLTSDNKLNEMNIDLTTFAVDKFVYTQNIHSSLYHEITHAFENYNRLLKHNENHYLKTIRTNYNDIAAKASRDTFSFINYYLLNQSELNANVASVYGDLERLNSVRSNFKNDIYKTDAFENYNLIKTVYLPEIIKLGDDRWTTFKNESYLYRREKESVPKFKRDFINAVDFKLNDLYRGIGRVASLYYDDIEAAEKLKINNIKV